MDKSIITFSANEQNLQKTGGIGCYASDTVSYIEAHFDLGDNWAGYDSIRAVWFNDYKTISTVLDSDGVCIVPHEVLVNRGKVMVNLVGSVLVSDELKDRLTTFPCEALKVSAKAKISGSETAAVTPSQFEQFVSVVISEVEKVTGMTAQAETLPAGSQATARYENGILYLGIPQGIQGERGETGQDGADGNGIASVVYNADYTLTLVFDNGETFTTPPIRGERGPAGADGRDGTDGADGVTPNLSIGNVTTLEPSEDAYVTRRGTDANPIFDFGIPKGDTGTVPDLDLILPTDTASGDIASITDGQSVVPVKSLKVTLEPIQDLHGYDKPWSGGAGVNKLIQGETQTFTSNGVTWTANADGSITARGTAVGNSTFTYIMSEVGYTFNGNYKFVFFPSISATVMAAGIYIGKWISVYPNTTTSLNDLNAQIGQLWFQIKDGQTADVTFYPMIYSASETAPTAWAPYENTCPISGHTECVTEVCGVNVWDEEWELGRLNNNGEEQLSTTAIRAKNYMRVLPNETYYVFSGSNKYVYGYFYDADKVKVGAVNVRNGEFTAPSNAYYYRFSMGTEYGTAYNNDISINYPSTDHDYHAYNGNTYTTTLGRTVYGGTLDVVSGELVVDRAMVDLSTLAWLTTSTQTADGSQCHYAGVNGMATDTANTGMVSDRFSLASGKYISQMVEGTMIRGGGNIYVATDATTISGQLCYPLATPQTYQLAPTEVALLKGNNNVWSDGSVEVTYNADVGLYIDKKLGTSGTRTLSMTRTLDTKSEETKTDDTKSDNIQLAED